VRAIESLPQGTGEFLAHFVTPAIVLSKKDAGVTVCWALVRLRPVFFTGLENHQSFLIDDYMDISNILSPSIIDDYMDIIWIWVILSPSIPLLIDTKIWVILLFVGDNPEKIPHLLVLNTIDELGNPLPTNVVQG
jgi:hypothetical protein